MGINKRGIIVGSVVIGLFVVVVILFLFSDRNAPEISISSREITYHEGDDQSVLLEGVSARDEEDGDLTDKIRIEKMIRLDNGTQIKVIYVVQDSSGKIKKCSRVVAYAPAAEEPVPETAPGEEPESGEEEPTQESETEPVNPEAPVIKLVEPTAVISVGSTFNISLYIESITDDRDSEEDLFRRIQLEGTYQTDVAGVYDLGVYVIDSDGNVSKTEKLQLVVQ